MFFTLCVAPSFCYVRVLLSTRAVSEQLDEEEEGAERERERRRERAFLHAKNATKVASVYNIWKEKEEQGERERGRNEKK
jgi:hypothetical protein